MSMEDSHETYINKKKAEALIHHEFSDFEKSQLIPEEKLKIYRCDFLLVVFIAFLI